MKNSPLLSVIIPIYNSENYIQDCVGSLYFQNVSEEKFEILLVNDGSLDNSYEICQDLSREHTNIRLFSQKNQGQAVARNLGIEQARGKYIMFVDSDDRLLDKVVAKMLAEAEKHQTDILIGSMKVYNAQGDATINSDFKRCNKVVSGEYALLHGINTGSVCGRLFLNDFIKKNHLSFLPGIKHEDVLFTIKALSFAKRIISLNLCCYIYLWHGGSTDRSFDKNNKERSLLSNLRIAYEITQLIRRNTYSNSLSKYLSQKCNSLLASNLLLLMRNKSFGLQYLTMAKKMELFPVKGNTLSWKTTILVQLLNLYWKKYADLHQE